MASEQIIAIFTIMNHIHHNYNLKALNSFGLDARAASYAKPANLESLITLLEEAYREQLPLLILGEGSNILFKNDFEVWKDN